MEPASSAEGSHEWVCEVCGEQWSGQRLPAKCPKCGAAASSFVEQTRSPGD